MAAVARARSSQLQAKNLVLEIDRTGLLAARVIDTLFLASKQQKIPFRHGMERQNGEVEADKF
jgi:hypothetical protein